MRPGGGGPAAHSLGRPYYRCAYYCCGPDPRFAPIAGDDININGDGIVAMFAIRDPAWSSTPAGCSRSKRMAFRTSSTQRCWRRAAGTIRPAAEPDLVGAPED